MFFFGPSIRVLKNCLPGYAAGVKVMAKMWYLVLAVFIGLCLLTVYWFGTITTGFVPEEDQGYFLALVQLPDAATIERTQAVMKQVNDIALKTPGVADVVAVTGYNVIDQIKQPFAGFAFVILKPWGERKTPETQLEAIMAAMRAKTGKIPQARVMIANAPSIPGLGATGGFKYEIQDLNDQGVEALTRAVDNFISQARKRPELVGVYTTFNPGRAPALPGGGSHQGQNPQGFNYRYLRYPADQPGIAVCQRVQQVRPGLPGLSPGRGRGPSR